MFPSPPACLPLPDGRQLGDVPVNAITREMLGAVSWRVKEAGRSVAVIEQIRNPLRTFYSSLIETKVLSGPNPAADLRYFIGRGANRKTRARSAAFFAQEEGPALVATAKALFPRWYAFILTGLLGGLRWGESAALYKTDVDWTRGRIHVQRTFSEKGNSIEACRDGEARWVKASPALLEALREHLAKMELEGEVKEWTPEQRALDDRALARIRWRRTGPDRPQGYPSLAGPSTSKDARKRDPAQPISGRAV